MLAILACSGTRAPTVTPRLPEDTGRHVKAAALRHDLVEQRKHASVAAIDGDQGSGAQRYFASCSRGKMMAAQAGNRRTGRQRLIERSKLAASLRSISNASAVSAISSCSLVRMMPSAAVT